MVKWIECYQGIIPEGMYTVKLINGEKQGLIIKLESKTTIVRLNFGIVVGVRMLEESFVNTWIYSKKEFTKYHNDRSKNYIYEIMGGKFKKEIEKNAGDLCKVISFKEYLIITQNYYIDVVTQYGVDIEVISK